MTTREQWLELAARCKTTDINDNERDLGVAILEAAGWSYRPDENMDWMWHDANGVGFAKFFTPASSQDHIMELIRRELPGLGIDLIDYNDGSKSSARLFKDRRERGEDWSDAVTPELALCAAFCCAKAQGSDE